MAYAHAGSIPVSQTIYYVSIAQIGRALEVVPAILGSIPVTIYITNTSFRDLIIVKYKLLKEVFV